jgi:hypothetical protein
VCFEWYTHSICRHLAVEESGCVCVEGVYHTVKMSKAGGEWSLWRLRTWTSISSGEAEDLD